MESKCPPGEFFGGTEPTCLTVYGCNVVPHITAALRRDESDLGQRRAVDEVSHSRLEVYELGSYCLKPNGPLKSECGNRVVGVSLPLSAAYN